MDFLPLPLLALDSYPQFIAYLVTPSKTRKGKSDKLPVDYRTGKIANAHDPLIWAKSKEIISAIKLLGPSYGVGFVLTENDPFVFLDIDNCLSPCGTRWSDLANSLVGLFPGAAVEISSSGKGLHLIFKADILQHSCKNQSLNIELYSSGRFIALTGTNAIGDVNADFNNSKPINYLVSTYFVSKNDPIPMQWTDTPCLQWNGPSDDEVLIDRMLKSKSAGSMFGNKASFEDLWNNNTEIFVKAYPTSDGYDESSVDAALAQHLAFWTGNNCERIKALMYKSKLIREKWSREDYLPRTILSACGRQMEFLADRQSEITKNNTTGQAKITQGSSYLSVDQQIELFKGCTYVSDAHKILIPGGYLLNQERFRAAFGGYSFPIDGTNAKVTRNAWEAFTESQLIRFPHADSSTFRPEKAPGEIVLDDGRSLVNTYYPIATPRISGDPSPFLRHMEKLFGTGMDNEVMTSYLAALIRYLGVKFQWCPVIQGTEGNGKTFLSRIIAAAIGSRYTHFPKAQELSSKFNDWMVGKCFIGVDDMYDPTREIAEYIKPMITNDLIEIEPKGGAKTTQSVCCNFIINTNHKDGMLKHQGGRRFAPFFTRQQTVGDLRRDGMDENYFHNLMRWSKNENGFAITADYLFNFNIPDHLNPATKCLRAPMTSSTDLAIDESRGPVEQDLIEAIAQGVSGFREGWISSFMLDIFLKSTFHGRSLSTNRRKEILLSLGYVPHPGLKDGRTNGIVLPDNVKPRLYIIPGHPTESWKVQAEIARQYEKDNI